jgi:hypothetical protein
MNKLLTQNNEQAIKHNSADFLTLTIYSKDILGFEKIHFLNFDKFLSIRIKSNISKENNLDYTTKFYENKFKYLGYIGLSLILTYKFRSLMIVPIFFMSYSMTKLLIFPYKNENKSMNSTCFCYFCEENKMRKVNLNKYDYYYKLIDYVFDKNPNIKNIQDFEKEFTKINNSKM